MRGRKHWPFKTGLLVAGLTLWFGTAVFAAPAIEGDTDLTVETDQVVTAQFTVTNEEPMESVSLMLSYDKDVMTYMSGSGGDNFDVTGGNGSVQMTSSPESTEAVFTVRFRGAEDTETTLEVVSCTAAVNGADVDVLTGETVASEEEGEESDEMAEEDEENEERASFVIDDRTFYVRRPGDMEGFDVVHMDIQGIDSRVLKHNTLDLYVVYLISDNGSFRDYFVYNPDTGNVIPYVNMSSGTDTVIFIEKDEDVEPPVRYSYVDLGWGQKYTIPAYKHVTIDGVDEIFDDTNRYLVYGINQDGEKAWYSFDYDKNSLQLFDTIAYDGEQIYITELEEKDTGMRSEMAYQLERYNTDMGTRLFVILILVLIIIALVNVVVLMYLRMRKMKMLPEEESAEDDEEGRKESGEYIVGNLEENETDFSDPEESGQDQDLEIIDLNEPDEDDE